MLLKINLDSKEMQASFQINQRLQQDKIDGSVLLPGLMYLQLGTSRTSSIFDRQASLFLLLVMLAFTPGNTACTVWESERLLLRCHINTSFTNLTACLVLARVWRLLDLE